MSRAKALLRRSVPLTCAAYVAHDLWFAYKMARGNLDTTNGAAHGSMPVDEAAARLEAIYADYLAFAGQSHFAGRVAEIGPGDTLGIGILCRAGGSAEYHGVDRYLPRQDAEHCRAVHRLLAERCGNPTLGAEPLPGIFHHIGAAAETFFESAGHFDAILSRAVLEHLYDPMHALDAMAAALTPGGVMVHVIDFRDHGMFAGRHPLTFLTVPDAVYGRMVRASGRPNRVLWPVYERWLKNSGLTGQLMVTSMVGAPVNHDARLSAQPLDKVEPAMKAQACALVEEVRPRLAGSLRAESAEGLAVASAVLVARRPA